MYTTIVDALSQWCTPWADFYGDSVLTETIVTSLHLLAMLLGGGLAVAADRTTLRSRHLTGESRTRMVTELHAIHRPVLVSLVFLFVTGVAMTAADIATFAVSLAFAIKLALVLLLCVNGVALYRTERGLRREVTEQGWSRLQLIAWFSLLLWSATLVAGVALMNAA